MNPKVPNYNTLSSLLDRLAVENIKLRVFENALEQDDLSPNMREDFERKSEAQQGMIQVLRVGFESHAARANLRTRSMTEAA